MVTGRLPVVAVVHEWPPAARRLESCDWVRGAAGRSSAPAARPRTSCSGSRRMTVSPPTSTDDPANLRPSPDQYRVRGPTI
jgi:hypothetical protein